MPHNDILNDKRIKEVFREYVKSNEDELELKNVHIQLEKEPDYMFVVKWDRKDVLTDQLQAIEQYYQTLKRDTNETFGLLENRDYVYKADKEEYGDVR